MKIIIGGENGWDYFERMTFDGVIGIFYDNTWSGVLAYIIVIALAIFAAIGIIATLKFLFFRRKKKMTPHEKWMKTGKM